LCLEIRCFALALRSISRDQETTLDRRVGILKKDAYQEAEELEPGTRTGFKFTEDLRLVEDGNNAFRAIDPNKQPAETTTL
jgi:hypothetical protein